MGDMIWTVKFRDGDLFKEIEFVHGIASGRTRTFWPGNDRKCVT